MGYGDNLMATGMARGAKARGKRIAFGDRKRIIWDKRSNEMFANNPNIAPPAAIREPNLEWIPFYTGSRIYNRQTIGRWQWNMDFRAKPGEVFFHPSERKAAESIGSRFVLVEPMVPAFKSVAPNKQWPRERYQAVVDALVKAGREVVQFQYDGARPLVGARYIPTGSFRRGLAILQRAALYIGPEGGLHHGAAAVGVPAVVLFGGFIPPAVTGYDGHANLTGDATEFCGSFYACDHCRRAMAAIGVDEVLDYALLKLKAFELESRARDG